MNFWFWLCLLVPPLLVFNAKPETDEAWRANRLLFAVMIPWGLTALIALCQFETDTRIANAFYTQFPHCREMICPNRPIGNMTGVLFTILFAFSWLPALSMTGLYEIIWRIIYHRHIQALKYTLNDNLFSNIIIFLAFLAGYPNYVLIWIWLYKII